MVLSEHYAIKFAPGRQALPSTFDKSEMFSKEGNESRALFCFLKGRASWIYLEMEMQK